MRYSTNSRYPTNDDTQLVQSTLDSSSLTKLLQFLSAVREASFSLVTPGGVRVSIPSVRQGHLSPSSLDYDSVSKLHVSLTHKDTLSGVSLQASEAFSSLLD